LKGCTAVRGKKWTFLSRGAQGREEKKENGDFGNPRAMVMRQKKLSRDGGRGGRRDRTGTFLPPAQDSTDLL